jgi:ABC-2 type transport system permease protein
MMALAIPLMLLLLFGYALSLDVDQIPTLILDADQTPESRELIERFRGSRYFHIQGFVDEYAAIEQHIDRSTCLLGVVIHRNFSKDLLSGREADVQLLIDGSDSNTASIALGYAEGLLQTYSLELRARFADEHGVAILNPPIEGRVRVWYNSEMKSRNYIVPGLIAVILMIIAALLTSLTIAREWEMGTMEQLLSTPVRPTELVLGKMAAYFAVGLIDTLTALGVGVFIFDVPLRGSSLLVLSTSGLFLFGALCWGILLSAIARQQLAAFQMGILSSFLPAFLLSGFIFSIENMPTVVQLITHIFPARYFVTILKGIFLKGVGLQVLWLEIVFLLMYAAVVFVVATRKLRQKLA